MKRSCAYCGGTIPRERKRTSRYCSEGHRQAYKREAFAVDGRTIPPGPKLMAIRCGDHVFVAATGALRSRLRLALAGMPPGATLLGAIPGDAESLDAFRQRFASYAINGSWFRAADDLCAFFLQKHAA